MLTLNSNPISQHLFEIVKKPCHFPAIPSMLRGFQSYLLMSTAPPCLSPLQFSTAVRRENAYLALGLGKEGGLSKSEMLLGIEIRCVWVTSVLPRGHFLKGRYLLFGFGMIEENG